MRAPHEGVACVPSDPGGAPGAGAASVNAAVPSPDPGAAATSASATHQHLLNVVLAEIGPDGAGDALRLLDAGCGDGLLLAFLARSLAHHRPRLAVHLHGFDVHDHGVQPRDYFRRTLERLQTQVPGPPWAQRLALISDREAWPWPAGSFDMVVSNQVLEHVRDHHHFMTQLCRVLRPGGVSVHVFPSRHCWIEPHLHMPFAHRIGSPLASARYIEWASRLGFGRHDPALETRRDYAHRHADYLARNVNYKTVQALQALAQACGLEADFGHTAGLFTTKLRMLLGRPPGAAHVSLRGSTTSLPRATLPFRWLSSVTLLLRRPDTAGDHPEPVAAPQACGHRAEAHRP